MRRLFIVLEFKSMIFVFVCFVMLITLLLTIKSGSNSSRIVQTDSNQDSVPVFNMNTSDVIAKTAPAGEPKIKVYLTKKNRIEEMTMEEYISGVVASEMSPEYGDEALKAQAVAARTFALSHMEAFGGEKCSKGKGADICDTTHCQAYKSKDELLGSWPQSRQASYWDKISNAVKATYNQVIKYDGKLAMYIKYFAVSGGRTEDAAEVFAINEPYLRSVQSEGDETSQNFKSVTKIKAVDLATKINASYPKAKVTASNLRSQLVILAPKNKGGSVRELRIGNSSITGVEFRSLLGLKSANFQFKYSGEYVEITTYGYGHGVGMSQWGANVMSKQGQSYIDILTHYYQGVQIGSF